jgi:solute carrier family 35, member F1/2
MFTHSPFTIILLLDAITLIIIMNFIETRQYIQRIIHKSSTIIRGQMISVLISGTGIFATFLSNTKPTSTNFPTLMSLFNYSLLSTYILRICFRKSSLLLSKPSDVPDKSNSMQPSHTSLYWYALAAVLDVEANYLVILAYNYTTITSVMLLDCFTIPSSMILSYFFLSYQYTYKHIIGATICILGLMTIVATDIIINSPTSPPNAFLGDVFCLVGSLLYATSNVMQEYLVKSQNREEYLAWLGIFGSIVALIQCMAVDLPGIERANLTWDVWLFIFGFVTCLFLMYVNTSLFLVDSDATLFNLSLLTSDVYAVIFSFFIYGELVYWTYFLAFGLVIVGLFIYHRETPPDKIKPTENDSQIHSVNSTINLSDYSLVSSTQSPFDESLSAHGTA